uniref:ribosomal protein L13 n=1 Tax=Goniotrichopsis reniformis TaxID=468933 RepID=UPI001FCD97C3|nr:ribosomal protein L13 [Goniotrichopsis reniformis]UNJ14782.1 ribosomal protein L13 [Goniotrichopsis reniformis]
MNKTTIITKQDTTFQWYLIDAKDKNLGRLATEISNILRGKKKSIFMPYLDLGDFVIVINAAEITTSGKKSVQKIYRKHSGRPGGMRTETLEQLQARIPARVIESAVKGMLPKGALGRQVFKKLKVYPNNDHPHTAQKPILLDL